MYSIQVKSGTNGYYNEDNCDMHIATINSDNIPKIGEMIELSEKDGFGRYLVTEVERYMTGYNMNSEGILPTPSEFVTVYVLKTEYFEMEEYAGKFNVLTVVVTKLLELTKVDRKVYKTLYAEARAEVNSR